MRHRLPTKNEKINEMELDPSIHIARELVETDNSKVGMDSTTPAAGVQIWGKD